MGLQGRWLVFAGWWLVGGWWLAHAGWWLRMRRMPASASLITSAVRRHARVCYSEMPCES
ncbi:hypothetical protein EHS19_02165 [Bifidobacterium jacchi]|uniref:Uncharacterized protein n=1 Tax=Bifidobacterium jacchi TaxID=2490545 RepID=A0A5N5RLJ3_9BIFI|nr:hypothetical protein EHS19_02165 [Bifidobacterium jacchi]